ncbi:MAG TPA: GspH/FimT family pseudopilin [Longimicrobium sp.]|jgi:prepilin-type N-terminal cleavage/methylation domain-containing protein|nr:GspH/FimT family pseudopilin [Longimicrobium sp.]
MPTTFRARPSRLRDRSGRTLMEMMVVVVIIGLILAMAGPRTFNYVSALSSGSAASQLSADIAYTRMMAVREGRTAVLTLTDATTYTIVVENLDGTVFRTLRTVRLANSFPGTTVAGDGGVGRLAFDSRGILKANSARGVTLTRGARSQRLAITLIGRVTRDAAQ